MRIGVPKETAAGEHRVALVPEVVSKLTGQGPRCSRAERGGEDALLTDDAVHRGRRTDVRRRAAIWRSDIVVTIAPPDPEAIRDLGQGSILIGFLAPLTSPADDARRWPTRARRPSRWRRSRASRAPRRWTRCPRRATSPATRPRCSARREHRPLLPDADDRRRHDPARQGARPGRRRGRAAGARDGQAPRARARPATTCDRRSPSRSQSLGASGSTSGCEAERRGWLRPRADRGGARRHSSRR